MTHPPSPPGAMRSAEEWVQEHDAWQILLGVNQEQFIKFIRAIQVDALATRPAEANAQAIRDMGHVVTFLLGETSLDGMGFGDSDTRNPLPRYWWRKHLRKAWEGLKQGTRPGESRVLRETLEKCAAQFRFYAEEHLRQKKMEKYQTNYDFYTLCRDALDDCPAIGIERPCPHDTAGEIGK